MYRIVVPLMKGGILSAATLLFVFSVRELGPALFLFNPQTTVMAVQVISSWESGDIGGAAALALVQSIVLLVVVFVARTLFGVKVRS